jgi:hypothetical protein
MFDMTGSIDVNNGMGMLVLLSGGLFKFLLSIWLIIKGFNPSTLSFESNIKSP